MAPILCPPSCCGTRFSAKSIDRASDLPGYEGTWRNPHGSRCGSLIINSDGSYYAEYDVLTPHPDKPAWFVEAVTAWGRDGVVKAEPRLLAAV